jgi:hypothetical protein
VLFWLRFALRNPRACADIVTAAAGAGAIAFRAVLAVARSAFVRVAEQPGRSVRNTTDLEHRDGAFLYNVHDREKCEGGTCPVHRMSDHPLRSWPQNFRQDAGFMERVCQHGVGHPDPDDRFADPVHGCDGCCAGARATNGLLPGGGPEAEA